MLVATSARFFQTEATNFVTFNIAFSATFTNDIGSASLSPTYKLAMKTLVMILESFCS